MIAPLTRSLRRVLTLMVKELTMVLKDPKSRFVVIGPPIIQFFLFGYAATFDVTDVRYAVLDDCRSQQSRAVLARFEGSEAFDLQFNLNADHRIAELINTRRVRLVLRVPPDFSENLHAGQPAQLQAIVDGRNSNVAQIALGYVSQVLSEHTERVEVRQRLATDDTAANAGPQLIERAWFNQNLLSRWYVVSALGGVISMVIVTLLAALSVAREREFGTFDQLQVAPFHPAEILVGKATPGLLFGVLDALALSAFAVWWYQVPFRGEIPALVAVVVLFTLSIIGLGLFISSLANTMQQALLGSFVFIVPAVVLGGFTTPIENMPDWLQTATLINPLRYVMSALREVFLRGAGVGDVWPQLWPMALIAAVTLPLAAWMFRHRGQ